MNKGMPNAAKLGSRALLVAGGISGILGWILQMVLDRILFKASQRGLVVLDLAYVGIVTEKEREAFDAANSAGWAAVKGKTFLTKEEADAINKPVIDAIVKFGTLNKLRKRPGNN